jgi:hypothetical protein
MARNKLIACNFHWAFELRNKRNNLSLKLAGLRGGGNRLYGHFNGLSYDEK